MSEILIACSMIEDELKKAFAETGSDMPVIWMECGLHEYPDRLRNALTEKIIEAGQEYDTIVLAYGSCGNGTIGLKSARSRLVIPLFDDCIRILTAVHPGQPSDVDTRSLYYTRGWLVSNLVKSDGYERCVQKFGAAKTQYIYREMVKNYRSVCLLDTSAYELESAKDDAQHVADVLGLELTAQEGTLRILRKLVTRQWDDEFLICQPGEEVQQDHFFSRFERNYQELIDLVPADQQQIENY